MVEAIFRYRSLIGKCELGCGLTWEEIDQLTAMERAFLVHPFGGTGRISRRAKVSLHGVIRGDGLDDRVEITELGIGGLLCKQAPWIACGAVIELVIDVADRSYRFRAISTAVDDDGDDYQVEMVFVGVPVCLNMANRCVAAA